MKQFMNNLHFFIKILNQLCIFIILLIIVYSAILFVTLLPEISEIGESNSYERID